MDGVAPRKRHDSANEKTQRLTSLRPLGEPSMADATPGPG